MGQKTIRLPAGISSLVEVQLEKASQLRHEASTAEHLAVTAVQDYCVALGIPPDASYQYDRANRSVVITMSPHVQQATQHQSSETDQET